MTPFVTVVAAGVSAKVATDTELEKKKEQMKEECGKKGI
jgi:hypothetical protein